VLLEVLERLRGVVERQLGELRERVGEVVGKVEVDAVADPRAAHDMQQPQVLVEVGPPEQPSAHLGPVRGPLIVRIDRVGTERHPQGIDAERRAALDERKIDAGATVGEKPPGGHPVGRPVGTDSAAAREMLSAAAQLDPQVADRLLLVAARKHPRAEHAGLLARRVDPPRIGLEQERQEHVHRGGLARAVDPSQQQAAASEAEHLVAVLVDVRDAGSVEHPAVGHRPRLGKPPGPAGHPPAPWSVMHDPPVRHRRRRSRMSCARCRQARG
jgi:hypothetical protein